MEDNYRQRGLRKQMIEGLKKKGGLSEEVLSAMERVPRHLFLDRAFEEWAYRDVPFPIGSDQTISQPYTVAMQSTLLDVKKGQKVLEIGTGSGYQACVLAEMGVKVYTVERIEALYKRTSKLLRDIGYEQVRAFFRDGNQGLPRFAPYDRILVTAATDSIPHPLLEQLSIGGVLVIPVGGEDLQSMYRVERSDKEKYTTEKFGAFRFVPFLKGLDTRFVDQGKEKDKG